MEAGVEVVEGIKPGAAVEGVEVEGTLGREVKRTDDFVFLLNLNNAFRACCQDRFRSFYFVIFQMWFVMLRHANIIKSRWSSAHFAQSAKTIRNFVTSASRKRRFHTNRSRGRGHYALLGWE